MRIPDNIREVIQLSPDFLGFIFYEQSPRYVGDYLDKIREVGIPEKIKKVGVFVNEDLEGILVKREKLRFDLVQLHGNESFSLCQRLQQEGLEVIKVFSVGGRFDFDQMENYSDCVDYFLFDTKGKYYGGNNIPFDWSLIEGYPFDKPFFLGGGIGIDKLPDIGTITNKHLYAVDANSKLESSPGIKDLEKVKMFKEKFDKINI
jgi:phosphoribosylanthranilate isomerase